MRIRKTSWRLLEVLAVACLLNWMWYPLLREPIWLFRLDILHCVGLTLFCALPLVAWLSPRPWVLSIVMAVIAVGLFSVAPLLESTDGFLARFVTEKSVSIFPLVPWAAYVFVGACIGSIAAGYGGKKLIYALVALAALCFALWELTPTLSRPYPPHELWRTGPGPHAYRIFWVAILALGLRVVEARVQAKNRVVQFIEKFGTSSLSAYFFHLTFLYYELIPRVSYRAQFGGSLSWPSYWVATVSLIALTFFAVIGYERFEAWLLAFIAERRAASGQLAS